MFQAEIGVSVHNKIRSNDTVKRRDFLSCCSYWPLLVALPEFNGLRNFLNLLCTCGLTEKSGEKSLLTNHKSKYSAFSYTHQP